MFGLFKKKKIVASDEPKLFRAFFRRIVNQARARNELELFEDDFDLIFDFVRNEVINAGSIAWNKDNILADADELELVIMAYHVWYLFAHICLRMGLDGRQRIEFHNSALGMFLSLIEQHQKVPYPNANTGNKLDNKKFVKDVEMLVFRVEKIYGAEKIDHLIGVNFLKCLGDLDDQSSEMVGRRSLALMMTQIHDKIAV